LSLFIHRLRITFIMKKSIIVLIVLFTVNLACKKENIGGGGLCACSLVPNPRLNLVVKSATGTDLLNPETTGYFSASQIQLYYLGQNGNSIPVKFVVRQPFSYGNNKFLYYQIFSEEIATLAKNKTQSFYLKLGTQAPHELNLEVNYTTRRVEKLLINKVDSPVDNALLNYVDIFYLTTP
jgi:hypothetical protein